MFKIALALGGIWIVGFVVIVALAIRKHVRRRKREGIAARVRSVIESSEAQQRRYETRKWKLHLEDY